MNNHDFILVFFLKRAQILIADIWACFEGKDYGALDGIEHLTAFADYRIPQVRIINFHFIFHFLFYHFAFHFINSKYLHSHS